MSPNCIIVCVDMWDILEYTLSYNREHFSKVVVVTSPFDPKTRKIALNNNAIPFITDAFYRSSNGINRDQFNKWTALEHGLDFMGRDGWICIMDADIVWPKCAKLWIEGSHWCETGLERENLYTPRRRMEEDLSTLAKTDIPNENLWRSYPLHPGLEFAGYTQIFHGGSSALSVKPWFPGMISAGTADSFFQDRWPRERKIRPPWEVLHLGPCGRNWLGRVVPMIDGTPVKGSSERNIAMQRMLARRELNPPSYRFIHERIDR